MTHGSARSHRPPAISRGLLPKVVYATGTGGRPDRGLVSKRMPSCAGAAPSDAWYASDSDRSRSTGIACASTRSAAPAAYHQSQGSIGSAGRAEVCQVSRISTSSGSIATGSKPSAEALALTGDLPLAQRSALHSSKLLYGLVLSVSPSIECQTG